MVDCRKLALLASCLWLLSCDSSQDASQSTQLSAAPVADVVFINARIYTVDENDSWAEAMAVANGRLLTVGTESEMQAHVTDQTLVFDLEGRMVMPGIHDTHIHPLDAGIGKTIECSFNTMALSEALSAIQACADGLPEGRWLRGGQWNDALFVGESRSPRSILDEAVPDHPVFLMDWSVHNAWLNTAALELLGIDEATPDPDGGVIVRDPASGEATGILLDNAAYNLRRELPKYSLEQRTGAMDWALQQMAAVGVTTFKDAIVTRETMETYDAMSQQGQLPLRVNTSLTWKSAWADSRQAEQDLITGRERFRSERLDTDFAKIMLDGIPPSYTAAMLDPYQPGNTFGDDWRGKLMIQPEQLAQDVSWLDANGLTVKIHATGDRSARVALDAFAAAREANGDSGLIHEVSHAELIHPDDIPRFAQLNVAAEMCPILWYPIPGLDWESWLGPDRKVWPVRSLVEAGALVIYGSDWPVVSTPDPWPGIEAMVTRADPTGASDARLVPEQAIDLATAIRIFTRNGATAHKSDHRSGSLESGKDADFLVLDRNIFEVPIDDVGETRVLMTVVGGAPVHSQL